MDFTEALRIAHVGFDVWADKPHNARWYRTIDGTPIPNDLRVCIAQAFVDALSLSPAVGGLEGTNSPAIPDGWILVPREPTAEMLDAAEVALNKWRSDLPMDEKMLRHVLKEGRGYTEATVPEKHAIRWRAMIAAAAPFPSVADGGGG